MVGTAAYPESDQQANSMSFPSKRSEWKLLLMLLRFPLLLLLLIRCVMRVLHFERGEQGSELP
jgi:hypothetical protein